jgi:transforming growth factor-beta-induced protein
MNPYQTPQPRRSHRRRWTTAAASLAVLSGSIALAAPASANGGTYAAPTTIVSVAKSDPDLSILVQAVVKAGLADTLSDPNGQFTVFAPTNEAFVALLKQLGVSSLDDIPVATLRAVFLDHVITGPYQYWAGNLEEADWNDQRLVTAGGLALDTDRAPLSVNDAAIVAADIPATNGVVHVIDRVLLDPDPRPTIVGIASSNPDFSILTAAVIKAGLADTLADPSANLTVFAPTNEAFVALLAKLGVASLDDIPVDTLRAVLLDHVVVGELDAVDVVGRLESGEGADSIGGLWLQFGSGPLTVNGVNIVATDIEGSNGTVHVIDQVLLAG